MVGLDIDPPPSSRAGRRRGGVRRVLLAAAFAATLAAGFWLGRAYGRREAAAAAEAAEIPPGGKEVAAAASALSVPPSPPRSGGPFDSVHAQGERKGRGEGAAATSTPASTSPPTPTADAAPALPGGPLRLAVTLSGPLEDAVKGALRPEDRRVASELTAVVNRLLVWDLRIARDGRRGDRLEVLWRRPRAAAPGMPDSGEPVVEAVRYASSKAGKVFAAYRFQPEGSRWARYYRPDGTELEPRLAAAPVADYEQITSLLRDGRRHKGVDFKTPVGSPVHAPFDGVVERRNWNFAGNGNCLDIRDPASGRHAIFLHLDVLPREMAVGRSVKKGEIVAASGNSGHSFAPHLHYQLEDTRGNVLDPFEVERTERRALGAAQKAAFDAERAKLEAMLGT